MDLLDLVNLVVLKNLLILVILPGILNIWVVFFDLCECSNVILVNLAILVILVNF